MKNYTELRITALSQFLGCDESEISHTTGNEFEHGSAEYIVVDDADADELWDEELDYYLDELVLPDLPENARNYFDREAWKSDARYDGRGHALARYDGHENEEVVGGITYYIYRQN